MHTKQLYYITLARANMSSSSLDTLWVVRPDDLVVLKLSFKNFVLKNKKQLVRETFGQESSICVTFQPQHIAEQTYPAETQNINTLTPSRISGLTRLVFVAPSNFVSINYTLSNILEVCTKWRLKIAANANRFNTRNRNPPTEPTADYTSIELPYRLLLSPLDNSLWVHASTPYVSPLSKRVEVWHTTLTQRDRVGFANRMSNRVRALYTRDNNFANTDFSNDFVLTEAMASAPFADASGGSQESLTADARGRIVHNSSDYSNSIYTPLPIEVENMHLSALGGTLAVHGYWEKTVSRPQLVAWKHRAALGRDEEVVTSTRGNLLPFGNQAVLLSITRRSTSSNGVSILESFSRISVVEPLRIYNDNSRANPFSSVMYEQLSTPDLPGISASYYNGNEKYKIIDLRMVEKIGAWQLMPISLQVLATDRKGNSVRAQVPIVLFLDNPTENYIHDEHFDRARYNKQSDVVLNLHQRVAYADSDDASTTYFTHDITFDCGPNYEIERGRNSKIILPRMVVANIIIDAVQNFTTSNEPAAPLLFRYFPAYLENEFSPEKNFGEIFLSLVDKTVDPPLIDFSNGTDRSGGFLQPNTTVQGLSRKIGTVGGKNLSNLDELSTGTFDPSTFLGDKCKLFGAFSLQQLLNKISDTRQVPSFITRPLNKIERLAHDVQELNKWIIEFQRQNTQTANDVNIAVTEAVQNVTTLSNAIKIFDISNIAGYVVTFVSNITKIATAIKSDPAANGSARMLERQIKQFIQTVQNVQDIIDSLNQLSQGIDIVKDLHVHLTWRPDISFSDATPDSVRSVFYPRQSDGLLLSVETCVKPHKGTLAGNKVFCSLDDFVLMLVNTSLITPPVFSDIPVTLEFKSFQFTVEPHKKPDISVNIGELHFGGVLGFIETLRNIIPLDGFSDPPNLKVDSSGLIAGFSVGLPSVAIGIFSLENITLSAELAVPFLGDTPLSFSFSFCSADHPFLLTVALLGGGGYFNVKFDINGINTLEAALEFGANLSINLGVASGSVCIMAGIYFYIYRQVGQVEQVKLSGFFRIRGEVDVLGLISASIELRMDLEWEVTAHKVKGEATIVVEVDIMFFSTSVEIYAERSFAGSNGDPTLEDVMAPERLPNGSLYDPWSEYCLAYRSI